MKISPSREKIAEWQGKLHYFCYKKAYGGKAKDADTLVAGIRYFSRDDLLSKTKQLGIPLHRIPERGYGFESGKTYPTEWYQEHSRFPVQRFPDLEQPAKRIIEGIQVYVWIESNYIRFRVSGLTKPFQVTDEDVSACLRLESKFDALGWQEDATLIFASDRYYFRPLARRISMELPKRTFTPTTSEPDCSWESRIARWFLGTVLSLFVGIPVLWMLATLFFQFSIYTIAMLLFLSILFGLLWLKQKTAHTHIRIDATGIHYIHKLRNTTLRTVRWMDFKHSPKSRYDVFASMKYIVSLQLFTAVPGITWHELRNGKIVTHWESFGSRHLLYLFMDTKALRKAFLEGLREFRPDIRIHPGAFTPVTP